MCWSRRQLRAASKHCVDIICAPKRMEWLPITMKNLVSSQLQSSPMAAGQFGRSTSRPIGSAIGISRFWSPYMDSILKELQEIFRDVLDQPELVLTRESNASNVEDWDSLGQINLVTVIEKRYKRSEER